jgi:hypothetical protein
LFAEELESLQTPRGVPVLIMSIWMFQLGC